MNLNIISKIPVDKQSHFFSGAMLGFAVALFLGYGWGLIVVIVAGTVKEFLDSLGFGTPDVYDFVATLSGGLFMCVCYLIAMYVK